MIKLTDIQEFKKKISTKYQKWRYNRVVKAVLDTPPLKIGKNSFTTLSMVHQRDVLPYLVAIKSFAKYADPTKIVIVCDPTIGDAERSLFKEHIPHVELRRAEEFRFPDIPIGGTWERLSAITEYARNSYTVQLDADTVTLGPVKEVIEAIQSGNGFVIGERSDQKLLTLDEAAALSKDWNDLHIQAFAEKRMNTANLELSLYVRGCSGFSGFPIDTSMRGKMVDFSKKMKTISQSRWAEWGTEQITSNYLVANSKGAKVLPFPAYRTPKATLEKVSFAHFIGYIRFSDSLYREASRRLIAAFRQS